MLRIGKSVMLPDDHPHHHLPAWSPGCASCGSRQHRSPDESWLQWVTLKCELSWNDNDTWNANKATVKSATVPAKFWDLSMIVTVSYNGLSWLWLQSDKWQWSSIPAQCQSVSPPAIKSSWAGSVNHQLWDSYHSEVLSFQQPETMEEQFWTQRWQRLWNWQLTMMWVEDNDVIKPLELPNFSL